MSAEEQRKLFVLGELTNELKKENAELRSRLEKLELRVEYMHKMCMSVTSYANIANGYASVEDYEENYD